MKSRKNVLTTVSLVALTAIFAQFQNCAPAGTAGPEVGDAPVMISDDVHNKSIQFVSQSVEVQDGIQSAVIAGLCNRMHNSAKLSWTVLSVGSQGAQAAAVFTGESQCERGQFGIVLNSMHELECGTEHILSVHGEWGGATSARVVRRCQALASQPMSAPEGSPYGTECALEYLPGSEDGANCNQVCYRDHKVVFKKSLASDQCSGLIERLAGP